MGVMTNEIFEVIEGTKRELFCKLQSKQQISNQMIRAIICRKFRDVAKRRGRQEGTIRNACTRGIGIKTEDFYKLVIEFLRLESLTLLEVMQKEKKINDDHMSIYQRMLVL